MLAALTIRDIVLIKRLHLDFAPGLVALTGETGAGKSILLDALGLALGARAEARLVRHGADQGQATALFDISPDHRAFALLSEHGLEAEPPLVLRRSLSADGRSRAYINDQPVGVGLLRSVGEALVEIHGQGQTHGLLDSKTHRALLDAYGDHAVLRARTADAWGQWQDAQARLHSVRETAAQSRAEEELLRHRAEEIAALAPEGAGEEARLDSERSMLMHASQVLETLDTTLAETAKAETALASASRDLARLAGKLGEGFEDRFGVALASLDRAAVELQEASLILQGQAADTDLDPARLERLFALRALARKLGTTVDDLPALAAKTAETLSLIEDEGEALNRAAAEVSAARAAYSAAAEALSTRRHETATALDAAVAVELAPLKLGQARFATEIAALEDSGWGPDGQDRVSFQVATNPGSPPGPLAKIASGGELARFMLALRVVLAQAASVPVLVFDEVDAGIGGAVADAVGERLARLAGDVQVLVVTHSPQVAARADHQFQVAKQPGETAETTVGLLSDAARQEEIARMLAGATITEEARAAAQKLLEARA